MSREESDSVESGVAGPLAMEALLERLAADTLEQVGDVSAEMLAALTLDDWMGIQLWILERVGDPSLCEEVFHELKQLKENAYLPSGDSISRIQPIDKLIQYAFMQWTRQDPSKAIALESQWGEPPTVYWAPFEAILVVLTETNRNASLQVLLERMDGEPLDSIHHPITSVVWFNPQHCVDLFEQTHRVRHSWLISALVESASLWRTHDAADDGKMVSRAS